MKRRIHTPDLTVDQYDDATRTEQEQNGSFFEGMTPENSSFSGLNIPPELAEKMSRDDQAAAEFKPT